MYPVGANGGSQAIVDARTLAWELASSATVAAGLASYERARRDATSAVVLANRDMDRTERAAVEEGRPGEVAALAVRYQRASGSDVDALNARPSLTPARR